MWALLPLFLSVSFRWSERESQENGVEELKSHETAQLVFAFSDLSTNLGTCETAEQKYH